MGIIALSEQGEGARAHDHKAPENGEVHKSRGLLAPKEFFLTEGVDENAAGSFEPSVEARFGPGRLQEQEATIEGEAEEAQRGKEEKGEKNRRYHFRHSAALKKSL
jgi:hypothetical protein